MISFILPTLLPENKKYLDLAIESINNLNYNKQDLEIIVVSAYDLDCLGTDIRHSIRIVDKSMHYAEKINAGVRLASPSSEYFFLLSDDIILTRNSVRNMINLAKANGNNAIISAISNCDNTRKYQLMTGFGNKTDFTAVVDVAYSFEQWKPISTQLMNAESIYPVGVWFNNFLCFYAVLIPARVWKIVGELDEKFRTGQEDIDYCIRAKEKKVSIVTTLDSLIWHFSGKTADLILNKKIRNENEDYFKEKWGKPVEEFMK